MKVNTYGLTLHGLKHIAGVTKQTNPRAGLHYQIAYNPDEGRLVYEVLCGQSWCNFVPGFITVADTYERMTMQDIADAVKIALEKHAYGLSWCD